MIQIRRALVGVLALLVLAVPLYAAVINFAVRPGNFTFAQGATVNVPLNGAGLISLTFNGSGRHMITYSAECAVGAPAGNDATWLNIDIVLDPAGAAAPVTLLPTAGTSDAFCTSNGSAGVDGWVRPSISVATPPLAGGNHTVTIRANIQNGAAGDSGWLGDSALIVTK